MQDLLGFQPCGLVTFEVSISTLKQTKLHKSQLDENIPHSFVLLSFQLETTRTARSSVAKTACFVPVEYDTARQRANCGCKCQAPQAGGRRVFVIGVHVADVAECGNVVGGARLKGTGPQALLRCLLRVLSPEPGGLWACVPMNGIAMPPSCLGAIAACLRSLCSKLSLHMHEQIS